MFDRWLVFENFFAEFGHTYPGKGYSLDRIKNERGYEPGNVRWATPEEQANNRRNNVTLTFRGETLTIAQWARRIGITRTGLAYRLAHGWTTERALTTK